MFVPQKWVILTFVLGLTGITHAQRTFDEHEVLFADISSRSIPAMVLSSAERDSLYRLLARDSDYCGSERKPLTNVGLAGFIEQHEQHVTFTDLNNDTFVDVVFDGMACIGHESGIVEILMGTPHGFSKTFFHWGRIMRYLPSTSGHDVLVHNYPCCAAYTNAYVRLSLPTLSDSAVVTEVRLLASPPTSLGHFFPERIDRSEAIRTIGPADLRWSPDTVATDMLNKLDNNVVAGYGVGAEGTLLYRQEKGPWGFVLMSSVPIDYKLDVKHLPQTTIKIYGWVYLSSLETQ